MDTPPEQLSCGPVRLHRWTLEDLPGLAAASQESWLHLRPWMPWAQNEPDERASLPFLQSAEQQWAAGQAFEFAIRASRLGEDVVGSCGLMRRIGPGGLEIGYWVHAAHTRCGLATAAAAALTWLGVHLQDVTHLEIHVDAANLPSRGVAAKLGYQHIGSRPHDRDLPGESGQDEVWQLTADDWPTSNAAKLWHASSAAPEDKPSR